MKYGRIEWCIFYNLSQIFNHDLFVIGVGDIYSLDQKPGGNDTRLVFVEFYVQ